ncbi:hypothetical protein LG198_08635 [Methylobacillus arboreus]|nr:hypothetical protein [Methylobacillus arboreus]
MMHMLRAAILSVACLLPVLAWAGKTDSHARTLAASCAACHGHEGQSRGEIPSLAGSTTANFLGKMKHYRDMPDDGSVMNQHAKGLTWEEIVALADYFAAIAPAAAGGRECCQKTDGQ